MSRAGLRLIFDGPCVKTPSFASRYGNPPSELGRADIRGTMQLPSGLGAAKSSQAARQTLYDALAARHDRQTDLARGERDFSGELAIHGRDVAAGLQVENALADLGRFLEGHVVGDLGGEDGHLVL